MKKEGLMEYLLSMNYGEYVNIIFKDNNDNFILGTMISKIRWFDTPVIVIGGYDDELVVSDNLRENDERIVVESIVNDCIGDIDAEIEIEKRGKVKIEFK